MRKKGLGHLGLGLLSERISSVARKFRLPFDNNGYEKRPSLFQ